MTVWREVTLGELINVKHGYAFKGEYFAADGEDVVLTPGNFTADGGLQFRDGKERFYTGVYPPQFRLKPGDLLVVMTDLKQDAPILGAPAFVPRDHQVLHNQRLGLVEVKNEGTVDRRFIYYTLLSDAVRSQLRSTATGTTVRHTAPERIYLARVAIPDIATQRTVGGILGAIDDLIENNRRRIELLEQMAQTIYREWFVHFRYPGHENATFVESPLGPIPEGWSVTTLGDAASWFSGGTPRTNVPDYWNGDIPWITSGTLTSMLLDRSDRRLTEDGVRHGSRLVQRDTLLFVVRGMSLVREFRVGVADVPLAFGQDCKALVARPGIAPLFLAFSVIATRYEIQGMVELAGHGTGKLSTDRLKAIEIPLPSQSVQTLFVEVVTPLREEMSNLRGATDQLSTLRDRLLPRLVTGKIDVSKLDLDALVGSVG